jgi:hypothetical protein
MTDTAPPLAFQWTEDGVMKPLNPRRADAFYAVGERYLLEPVHQRSDATHRHEFAWLREAWMSLPEDLADQYPTTEHLRKRALIDAGYYDESITDAGSNAAAIRVASAFRAIDDFSLVIVRGPLVVRRTAKSQSRRAMKAKEFQESKTAIMEVIASMIGVSVRDMTQAEAA